MAASFNPFKRGEDQEEAIRTGATNLTLGSGVVALLAVLAGGFVDFAKKVLGEPEDAPNVAARKDLLVALIVGWAILSAADVLARAYSKAATERRKAAEKVAETQAKVAMSAVVSAPPNLKASIPEKDRDDERGWTVVALRPQDDDPTKLALLVAKAGETAEWHPQDKVKFQ
jgi:hypothetical protein